MEFAICFGECGLLRHRRCSENSSYDKLTTLNHYKSSEKFDPHTRNFREWLQELLQGSVGDVEDHILQNKLRIPCSGSTILHSPKKMRIQRARCRRMRCRPRSCLNARFRPQIHFFVSCVPLTPNYSTFRFPPIWVSRGQYLLGFRGRVRHPLDSKKGFVRQRLMQTFST